MDRDFSLKLEECRSHFFWQVLPVAGQFVSHFARVAAGIY